MRLKIRIAMWLLSLLIIIVLFALWIQAVITLDSIMIDPSSRNIGEVIDHVNIYMASIFALVLLTIGIGLLSAKMVSDNIMKLRNAAREIGKGNLRARIKMRTGDEMEELAESLNRMAGDLERSESELEKKNAELEKAVKKRTKDLRGKVSGLERLNKLSVGREMKMIELKHRIKELEKRLMKSK
jgi:nitrate/nitrite-specific signal transduction histidine kinase